MIIMLGLCDRLLDEHQYDDVAVDLTVERDDVEMANPVANISARDASDLLLPNWAEQTMTTWIQLGSLPRL